MFTLLLPVIYSSKLKNHILSILRWKVIRFSILVHFVIYVLCMTNKSKELNLVVQRNLSLYSTFRSTRRGVFDRDFTKSLIIRDFDDFLKNPFRYVHLYLLHTLLSPCMTCNRGSKVAVLPPPPIERRSGPYKSRFLSNQFYLSEMLKTWSVYRNRWQENTQ